MGGQEHKLDADWSREGSAALAKDGWKAILSPALTTGPTTAHRSAGVVVAVDGAVGLAHAPEDSWDLSPPGCQGRLVVACIHMAKVGYVAFFSAYFFHSEGLTVRNVAILEAVRAWTCRQRVPWVLAADWNFQPEVLVGTLWLDWLQAAVKAPTTHTHRSSCGTESTLDWFLVDRGLAWACGEPWVDYEAATAPHWPVLMAVNEPIMKYHKQIMIWPRQFPMELAKEKQEAVKTEGVELAEPPLYPDAADYPKDQDGLDRLWTHTCDKLEEELTYIFEIAEDDKRHFRGRGQGPKVRKVPVVTKQLEPAGGAQLGPGRAWKWLAKQTAWLWILMYKAMEECSDLLNGTGRRVEQGRAVWKLLRGSSAHWEKLEPHTATVKHWLAIVHDGNLQNWDGLQLVAGLNKWARQEADRCDVDVKRQREKRFKEKLDDSCPQAQGVLHRVSKWRPGWQAPKSSVTKKCLPPGPQEAVEQEADEWSKIWKYPGGLPGKLWEGIAFESPLGTRDVDSFRRICRAFKKNTGIGVDGWHPWHWSWMSRRALEAIIQILERVEMQCKWPRQIQRLIISGEQTGRGEAHPPAPLSSPYLGGLEGRCIPRMGPGS